MCGEYFTDILKAKSFQNGLSMAISIFNVVLRYIVIFAVTWVGYSTQTATLERVTIVTFLC
jgi:hypothetical protein